MFITSFEPYIRSYQIISDHIRSKFYSLYFFNGDFVSFINLGKL
jgi:hypothetical protein